MLSPPVIILACCLYMAFIFAIALWVERKAEAGKDLGNNAIVYALSLTVFHTAWTFYGSIGKAASSGMLFLTVYLGPTLAAILWWVVLRKMVRIKDAYKVTSIADFVSLRYSKSGTVAALVTVIGIFALVPYYALQLKAITAAFHSMTHAGGSSWGGIDIALLFAVLIIVATVVLGVRRLAPTARHQGVVVAMTAASQVKLVAFLAVGIYVTYGLFGGIRDVVTRFAASPVGTNLMAAQTGPSFYLMWLTHLILAMSAVMFLPGQFHLEVVENFHRKHIRTAMWLFPLYMLVSNLFVLPMAMGGLLLGIPAAQGDAYAVILPMVQGRSLLSLVAFVGGFAAATGMMMISSMTVATMATNHLLLPLIESLPGLAFLKRYLLQCRWVTVALLVLAGYWFEEMLGSYFFLADIGIISFTAILQFAPAIIGGLFWRKGNAAGAVLGMTVGFFLWLYTLIIPAFAKGGFLGGGLLLNGPLGISMLRPEHLLGITGLDPAPYAVLLTMLFNIGCYVLGSLYFPQKEREVAIAEEFVTSLAASPAHEVPRDQTPIPMEAKRAELEELYSEYFPPATSAAMIEECLDKSGIDGRSEASLAELAELYSEAEIRLASAIGAAAAHKALRNSGLLSGSEQKALKEVYAEIMAELRMTPSELKERIDFHEEREKLLSAQATELEEKVRERDEEIAQRRKAEEELTASRRQLADIIDFLPDPTFVVDAGGRVIIWNRAAEDFTGVKAEEMLGKGDHQYSLPFFGNRRPLLVDMVLNPTEEVKALYTKAIQKGRVLIDESRTRGVNLPPGYVVITAAPLYDAEGKVTAVIESVRDITERREAEEELKKHRDRLEELVRERTAELQVAKERAEVASQAKSAFLSSMSHELRTPLNAILGYAQILRRQENLTDSQRQQLDIMRASGEHLLVLINDILDMSKIEAQRMELEESSFDLCTMLRQVMDITRIKAEEKSLDFHYEETTPLPRFVRGDQRKLKQVLLNLLSNAVKYTREGKVLMRVGHDGESALFHCEIADTGVGIAPEKLESIFEPFTQLEGAGQVREGTGLGLSISRKLLTLMQGTVAVQSEPGKGSTFTIELPLPAVAEGEIPGEIAALTVTGYSGPRKRVLIADDTITNTSMLVSLLEPLGFEIFTVDNGREAVRQALERRPDLVLLDLVMPELDGFGAVQEMRRHHELDRTRIIGTSAMASGSASKEAFAAACDDFLIKPIRIDLLLEKMRISLGIEWETAAAAAGATLCPPEIPEPEEERVNAPPAEELAELHELAVMGNMQKIQAWAAKLEERDPSYAPFAARLRDLAGRFRAKALLAMVEEYMRGES